MTSSSSAGDPSTSGVLPVGTSSSSGEGDESDTGIGSGLIVDPDGGGCPSFVPGTMPHCTLECTVFDQLCGEGEVCKPVGFDGAPTWAGPACRPVPDGPLAASGEPCSMMENRLSGLDDCVDTAMCLGVDPVTLEGTCAPYCSSVIACEDPMQTCFEGNAGFVPVCLDSCSPLLSDCPDGFGCYPGTGDDFVCQRYEEPLYVDMFTEHPACAPGSFMVPVEGPALCNGDGPCCTSFCDLSSPDCPNAVACVPFFGDLEGVDAALHDVGFCAINPA